MIPSSFDYLAPHSLVDATEALSAVPGAKVLAGGMSLLPAIKARLNEPGLLVDIGRVSELQGISTRGWGGNKLCVGSMTTHASIVDHPELLDYPIFSDAARVIADVQVRNRGTMGGSLVYADPAADWPAVFLALDGEVTLQKRKKKRSVKAKDFFLSMMTSAVGEGELLTDINFSIEKKRSGSAYVKYRQPASGLALAGVAVSLVLDRKNRIDDISIGVTGINAVPFLAYDLASQLTANALPASEVLRGLCADMIEADPMEDLHASINYRRNLLAHTALHALTLAYQRAMPM